MPTASTRLLLAFGLLAVAATLPVAHSHAAAPQNAKAPAARAAAPLNIGDPAPALRPAKWLKQAPIPAFEKGKVYVVEFWATWCGPCKANIPHLTELAKQYRGKVEVVGVDIWESDDPKANTLPKVEAFVRSQGAKMDYHVAADAPDNRVANAWMRAAGEDGIPAAFVVGKDGRIAWIGNPALGLAEVLPQVVAGTFDVAAARASRDQKRGPAVAIQKAMDAKDYAGAIRVIDAEISRDPKNGEQRWAFARFNALARLDVPEFEKRARALLAENDGNLGVYNLLCALLASSPGLKPEAYRFGLTLVSEALPKNERRFLFLNMGAEMNALLGEKAAAVRMQTEAVKAADEDPNVTAEGRERQRKALEKYRAAAGA